MDKIQQTIDYLREQDRKKQAALDAILEGMPLVRGYVASNRSAWEERRGAAALDQPSTAFRKAG